MENYHAYITKYIIQRFSTNSEHREEALRDVLALSASRQDDQAIAQLAATVPALPASLYAKWAALFGDRVLETVPPEQIKELCTPTENNQATLTLLFVMFMESARMEKQVAADIAEFNKTQVAP